MTTKKLQRKLNQCVSQHETIVRRSRVRNDIVIL